MIAKSSLSYLAGLTVLVLIGACTESADYAVPPPELRPSRVLTPSTSTVVQVLPTPTRVPTAIPTCPSYVEQAYFDALESEMRRVGTLTIMMSEDFQRASDDPYLILS